MLAPSRVRFQVKIGLPALEVMDMLAWLFSSSVLSKGLNIFRRFAPSCTATNLSPDIFTSRGMVEGLKGYGLGSIPCYCSVIKIANLGLVSGLLGKHLSILVFFGSACCCSVQKIVVLIAIF